ncbi:hypothetical protein [Sphingomonas sp. NFR04]|uniref:hypothetical protein n=1 Tax=Sphingomonas sp. NFR04 TaxID=1566283 RepID=UPI001587C9B5|nr:hypothetical protein [Sphingomonas sp. NFR04]
MNSVVAGISRQPRGNAGLAEIGGNGATLGVTRFPAGVLLERRNGDASPGVKPVSTASSMPIAA